MNKFYFILLSLYSVATIAQNKIQLVNKNNVEIKYALISDNDTKSTLVSNKQGFVLLPENITSITINALGYQTKTIDNIKDNSILQLDSIVLNNANNFKAASIIKNAIDNKRNNKRSNNNIYYTFYGKGNISVTNYPERFLGYTIDKLDPNLKIDSLKQKTIFTGENLSSVIENKNGKHKEIVANSYTVGNNQNHNFLTAYQSDIDFYNNIAYKQWQLISPISTNAFNYYSYKYDGNFVDKISNKIIHKIQVNPIRKVDAVLEGYIYLVDNTFEIFAIDGKIIGKNVQQNQVNTFKLQQTFKFNTNRNSWDKTLQTITFDGKILVFNYDAEFINISTDFENADVPKNTFSKKVVSYENTIDSLPYFESNRKILLTTEEKSNLTAYNEEVVLKNTKIHQDSIDAKNNVFNPIKLILGYKYRNTNKNTTYKYNGLLSTFAFNAVQGFNVTTGISYLKEFPKNETFYEIGGLVNYGIAENKPRFSGYYTHLFNRNNKAKLHISGGLTVHQFGEDFPIKKLINSLASSYFGKNFAKFYQKDYVSVQYQQDIFNGLFGSIELEYAKRKALFNNTINSPFVKDRLFTSNNPIDQTDFENPGFENNNILKLKVKTIINFDQPYIKYPHKKVTIPYSKYPLLHLNFETGFASNQSKFNYGLIGLSTSYNSYFKQYGLFSTFINAGKFLNAKEIAFMDYKHFYGNETFIGTTKNYLQNFNLLPYYSYSTNNDYFEMHAEHNFKGYVMNSIPLINKLQWQLVIGGHALYTKENKAYYETTIGFDNFGFGNFRPFRLDYVHSFNGTHKSNGIVLGIKLLDKMK